MATSDSTQVVVKPPLEKLKKRHQKMLKRLRDLKTPMKKVSIYLDKWVQDNFRTQGGKVGKWEPFLYGGRLVTKKGAKAQSVQGRHYIDPSAKLLQHTGRLKASYLPFATNHNAGIGSDLPYSKKHEEGEDGLPVRRMLPKQSEVIDDTRKILEKHMEKVIHD